MRWCIYIFVKLKICPIEFKSRFNRKMPLIPRTPIKINRYAVFYENSNKIETCCYEKFIDIYFKSNHEVQRMLLKQINDHVKHPVFDYILNTMTKENAVHVMGYLKSQNNSRFNWILNKIITPSYTT